MNGSYEPGAKQELPFFFRPEYKKNYHRFTNSLRKEFNTHIAMRNLTLSRVLVPLMLLVLASGHQGAVQASHLSEAVDPPQQHFLRSLEGSSADSGDADGGGDVEKCQAGCSNNNDVSETFAIPLID